MTIIPHTTVTYIHQLQLPLIIYLINILGLSIRSLFFTVHVCTLPVAIILAVKEEIGVSIMAGPNPNSPNPPSNYPTVNHFPTFQTHTYKYLALIEA